MKARILAVGVIGIVLLLVGALIVQADNAAPQMRDDTPLLAATPVGVQEVSTTPITVTLNAASSDAAGNTFANNGHVMLNIRSTYTGTTTATIVTPRTVNGLAVADLSVTIPAAGSVAVGPFLPELFNDTIGNVTITWSPATSITFAVLTW